MKVSLRVASFHHLPLPTSCVGGGNDICSLLGERTERTLLLQEPRKKVYDVGELTDFPFMTKRMQISNNVFGGEGWSHEHSISPINPLAALERCGQQGVVIQEDGITMSAKLPLESTLPEVALMDFGRIAAQARRLREDCARGDRNYGVSEKFATAGYKFDPTTKISSIYHNSSASDRDNFEFMELSKAIAAFDANHLEPHFRRYFAPESYLMDIWLRRNGIDSINFARNANGASLGFSLVNSTHTDADTGPTKLVVGAGLPYKGGHFGHGRHGAWHEVSLGDLLWVNPAVAHSTGEMWYRGFQDPLRVMLALYMKSDTLRGQVTARKISPKPWEAKKTRRGKGKKRAAAGEDGQE